MGSRPPDLSPHEPSIGLAAGYRGTISKDERKATQAQGI